MKINEVLEVHTVCKTLGSRATPLRATMAKTLVETTPIFDKFNTDKDNKFNDLVQLDEEGNPVLKEEVQKSIEEGKIKPNQGLPFAAYEFEDDKGLETLLDYVEGLKEKEVSIELPSISLEKKIRIKEEGKDAESVPLEDLLDAPDSQVTTDSLVILIKAGILK